MNKWKPAPRKGAMLSNRSPQLGAGPLAAAVPILIKWGLPFVAWAGGAFVATKIVSSAVPDVPINKGKIGLSSAFIGGGLTSYFLSEGLPEAWRPISYALAVAGVAAGTYLLLTPEEKEDPRTLPGGYVPPAQVVPAYTPAPMIQNFSVFADPRQPNTGGDRRWPYGDQTYEVLVTNKSDKDLTFFVGVSMWVDSDKNLGDNVLIYRTPNVLPVYGRQKVTILRPGIPTEGREKRIDVIVPSFSDIGTKANLTGLRKDVAVQFQFFRQQNDMEPFKVSDAFTISYTLMSFMSGSNGAEFHDELDINHVIGCKKCKRKKRRPENEVGLPTVPLVYPPSDLI